MKPRVLCFGAHPDDIELGCGGTIAALADRGNEVFHAMLTSGEAGSLEVPPVELARIREEEARASAKVLGVHEAEFLRYPDGLMHATREMKVELMRLTRRVRPDTVFVHGREDRFPDHRIAHDLVMAALEGASGPWYSGVGDAPHAVPRVLGYEVWTPISQPQLLVDVSRTIDQKLAALREHASQLKTTPYDEAARGLARYRGAMGRQGAFAEAFEVIRNGDLLC